MLFWFMLFGGCYFFAIIGSYNFYFILIFFICFKVLII